MLHLATGRRCETLCLPPAQFGQRSDAFHTPSSKASTRDEVGRVLYPELGVRHLSAADSLRIPDLNRAAH
jgi:hypothetical protein